MFLVTMPGMVMEKIKALFNTLGNYVAAYYGADTTAQIEETDIYETLDYLSDMGYDLKGYGFITEYKTASDVGTGQYLDEDLGVVKSKDDDTIVDASSDFIAAYIISDNYVYTLKNNNLATQEDTDNWFKKIGTAIATSWYRVRNFMFGPIFDFMGVTNAVGNKWGKGLIALYYEKDKDIGVKGTFVNTGSFWNWDGMKINMNNKTLSISRNEFFNSNNPIEYSLDGWSGRYGMPIEFLLSVHLSTLMPDLALDMAQSFPTEVNIYLHDISGEAISAYKTASGDYVTYEELNKALTGYAGRNLFSAIIVWFDNLTVTEQEVRIASKLGIDHAATCTCTTSEIEGYSYGSYIVYKDSKDKYYYIGTDAEGNEENVYIDEKEVTVETSEEYDTICDDCRTYLEKVIHTLAAGNDYNLKAYSPYIANVTDHWYRDVYFVVNNKKENLNFVDYDYEYEAMMKERWTLYETYTYEENPAKAGEYKLYRLDNGKLYDGTSEDAEKENVTVVKKAVTVKSTDTSTLKDLGWNNNSSNIWTAYEENSEDSETGYERIYTDDELASISDEVEKEVKSKLYINLKTTGNIVQTGEGQRTETNSTIKKIFLENIYFRYDGSAETAEIISELRKKVATKHKTSVYYGALDDSDLTQTATIKSDDGTDKTYTVAQYSGTVSLEQDSLNAFSMLENTHTLDSDYIYRDFKELMVELGYFTKEELTDETPRLLQWIVPDIASAGFPDRAIDKDENEYGTKIHSKDDINANIKNTMQVIIDAAPATTESPEGAGSESEGQVSLIKQREQFDIIGQVASLTTTPIATLKNVAGIPNVADATMSFTSTGSTGIGTKTGDLVFNGVSYETWKQTHSTCTLYAFSFIAQAYTGESPEVYLKTSTGSFINYDKEGQGGNSYWIEGSGVSWNMFDTAGISGSYYFPTDSDVVEKAGTALSEGKPVFFYGDLKATAGYHAVVLLGAYDGGKVAYFNPGAGSVETYGTSSDFATNLNSLFSNHFKHRLFIPDEVPSGVKSSGSGSQYSGYEGNEAVVSPVTGILLEYGTYSTEIDSITGEEYRVNTDLKNGINTEKVTDADGKEITTTVSETVHDKVGYAKILVLDAESYQKLETNTSNSWKSNSLVKIKDGTTVSNSSYDTDKAKATFIEKLTEEDQLDDWTNLDKTIYGYKEFAETYEKYGIAGYIVYIDGFICETPDEDFSGDTDTDIPDGDDLSLDSFKKITESNLTGKDPLDSDDVVESKYEKDDEYKLASQKATDKLNAESLVKDQANSTIYANNLVFIKEGTVIGRTMTDKELVENIRKEKNKTYDYYRSDSDDTDKVIGNYIRIIMRDLDDTVVENVENYMKIDENGTATSTNLDDDIFLQYLDSYESAAVYNYLYGSASYSSYVSKYITEDKQYFICYKDGANGNDDRNFGFGILHYLGGSYQAVDYYSQVGISINDGSYITVGSSKCPVDKVLEVQKLIIEGKRQTVISSIGQSNYDKLTKQQQDCLVDIAYQGCSSWSTLKSLLDSGATAQEVVNKWSRLTSTSWNSQARADARKKLWLEGIYVDSSGKELN